MKIIWILVLLFFNQSPPKPHEENPATLPAVTSIKAIDTPNDAGGSITLQWVLPDRNDIKGVRIERSETKEGPFESVKYLSGRATRYEDTGLKNKRPYFYKVVLVYTDGTESSSKIIGPVRAKPQWFNRSYWFLFIIVITYTLSVLWFVFSARSGREFYLRPIAGLKAVDDAVGRATEMGRPILFVTGLSGISDVVTIAALNVLSHITKKAAQYETKILVPHYDPMVYTVAQQIMKEAYTTVGRPDLFDPNSCFFVTNRQFAYAAAVSGIMVRERTAANFFMGYYYAESLILAETGAATGAIQIAGTDAVTQLPFFITACDYTLMGEELYAASAYLSKEPVLTATIKAQDLFKFIFSVLIIAGSILGILGSPLILNWFKF